LDAAHALYPALVTSSTRLLPTTESVPVMPL